MASKRKSSVPCMVPSKSKHMREEIILGCLSELLPTIPEDSILSMSGEDRCHFPHDSIRPEGYDRWHKVDIYSCPPCRFESRDLNYFLDHMHNCHIDFRVQPSFYCLNCGVSVVRFEALALHNAKAHPGVSGGSVTVSLHVRKRDGTTTVEQSLFTTGEDLCDSAISLTKTPIVRSMKAKGEHKKIVVSHRVEVRRIAPRNGMERTDRAVLTDVPEPHNGSISGNGGPATLRNPVTHVTTTTTTEPSQALHQHSPPIFSSSSSNRNLPKVMIPLSSIPTYDVAMDTSSFLKTSFGKFPYPTKAELCYLTVVSDWPEEQIKLWFTAQRLKQGISWSPEEIEEARRKMFNTIFQGEVQPKQPSNQRHANHVITHHTVHAQPAPGSPNNQAAKVPHGTVVSRHTGHISTSTSISAAGHQVTTRVTYAAPTMVPPKYQTIVSRTTQVVARNTIPTMVPSLEADRSAALRLGLAGSNCCPSSRSSSSSSSCSSSSISSYSSTSGNGRDNGARKPLDNISSSNSVINCSSNIGNNGDCSTDVNDKPKNQSSRIMTVSSVSEDVSSNKRKVIMSNTSNANVITNNSNTDNHNTYPCTNTGNDSNNNSIHKSNSSTNSQNHANKSQTEKTSTSVITKSCNSSSNLSIIEDVKCTLEVPMKSISVLRKFIKEGDHFGDDGTCSELKVDPIKTNLQRLMVSDPAASSGLETLSPELTTEPRISEPTHSSSSPSWCRKSSQQVQLLRQAFTSTSGPSSQQYEELSIMTGLPKPEVIRWFSDSRYLHKTGQLKWLEVSQGLQAEGEQGKYYRDPETETLINPQDFNRDSKSETLINPQDVNRDSKLEILINSQDVDRDSKSETLINPQEVHRDPENEIQINPQEVHRVHDTETLIHPEVFYRKLVEQKVNRELDKGPDRLSSGQQGLWWDSDTQRSLGSATGPKETGEMGDAVGTEETGRLQGHRPEREEIQQPVSSQAVEHQEPRDHVRIELFEV